MECVHVIRDLPPAVYHRLTINVKVYSIDNDTVTFFEKTGDVYTGSREEFPDVKLNDIIDVALTIDNWVVPQFRGNVRAVNQYRNTWE